MIFSGGRGKHLMRSKFLFCKRQPITKGMEFAVGYTALLGDPGAI